MITAYASPKIRFDVHTAILTQTIQAEEGKRSSLGTEGQDKSMLDKAKETAKEAKDKLNMGVK